MFARILNVSMNGVARVTVGAIVLIIGSACKGVGENCDYASCYIYSFAVVASGAKVLPQPADTTPRATGTFKSTTLAWTFHVSTQPSGGTIDSIAIYAMPANAQNCETTTCATTGTPMPGAANSVAAAILCAGAATCASAISAGGGTGSLVGATTTTSLMTLLRAYGGQLIVFTTTVRSGGVMRGTMYVTD